MNQPVAHTCPPLRQIVSPPNLISVCRIIPIPLLYWCLKRSFDQLGLIILGLALLTDALDGYIARRFRWQSNWGLILDPLADKMLIGSLSVFLVMFRDFPVWMAGLIILRDIAIVGVGLYLFFRPIRLIVPSNRTGKITTAVTSAALLLYMLDIQPHGAWCLGLAVVSIVISGAHYAWHFIQLLKQRGRIVGHPSSKSESHTSLDIYQKSGTGA